MRTRSAAWLYAAAASLYVLHQDSWLWGNPALVLGVIPIGLLYHVLFCAAASCLMLALTRFAWPHHLEGEAERTRPGGERPWR
jgi:hypothetical protein